MLLCVLLFLTLRRGECMMLLNIEGVFKLVGKDFHQRQSRQCMMFIFYSGCTDKSVISMIHMIETSEQQLMGGCSKCYVYIE